MTIRIVEDTIGRGELAELAREGFGDFVKAVVDVKQGIMAVGGELHADEEALLTEQKQSEREYTWGINLYPTRSGDDWFEFDSMVNIKPALGNRSRDVQDEGVRERIRAVVAKLVTE